MSASCRLCGAPVRYVRMVSGKRNPCEPEPDLERGNILIRRGLGLTLSVAKARDAREQGYDLYLSHFAVCEKKANGSSPPAPQELPANVLPFRRRAS